MVAKQSVRNVTQMMALKRMELMACLERANIRALKRFRAFRLVGQVDALWMVSCEKWQHPNIQRLFQVYHSPRWPQKRSLILTQGATSSFAWSTPAHRICTTGSAEWSGGPCPS